MTGQALVAVPDVRSKTQAEAITLLVQAGLIAGPATEDFDPVVLKGTVIRTSPAAGVQVVAGTTVDSAAP